MSCRNLARVLTFASFLCLLEGSGLAQKPLGEVAGAGASVRSAGVLAEGDPRVMSGSSISAGQGDATVKLLRGGELNVCHGTSISLTGSSSGQQIMVGLSSGIIEANYALAAPADMVMTPDFQIQLRGPGLLHFAISADEHGNTCVQALPGNTGSIRVSELMGDGMYDVGPSDQVFFRSGKASNPGPVAGNCGCPAPPKVLLAEAKSPEPRQAPPVLASEAVTQLAKVPVPALPLAAAPPSPPQPSAPPPPISEVHIEVDAPFVFRATEPMPIPDPPYNIARIQLSTLPALAAAAALPPEVKQAKAVAQTAASVKPRKKRKGLWAFLASIFGG